MLLAPFLFALSLAAAQPAHVDPSTLGPKIGETAPDFSAVDQNGRERTLRSLLGPKGLMLVFFRSAEWWPYCRTQLVELQQNSDTVSRAGLALAAISYDPPETLKAFAEKHGITYPLLSDRGSAIIRRYGILNAQASGRQAGIPHPGTFILDRQGRVSARQFEKEYQVRQTAASVLASAEPGGSRGTPIDTKYLVLMPSASDAQVSPGTRFTLLLDVVPKPKIHVYAPGQPDYMPITLTVERDPSYTVAEDPRYPKPEIYFFKPLNERFKVYSKPFRIAQDVVVSLSQDVRSRAKTPGASIAVKGQVEYQACDDAVCYLPVEAPVEWTVRLTPLK
jgi:peroxiredoxin